MKISGRSIPSAFHARDFLQWTSHVPVGTPGHVGSKYRFCHRIVATAALVRASVADDVADFFDWDVTCFFGEF